MLSTVPCLDVLVGRSSNDYWALDHFSYDVLASNHTKGPVLRFDVQVPRNVREAYELDKKNGNTNCQDAMQELNDLLLAYSTFEDHGEMFSCLPKHP
jgi:hypothetical protein